EQEHHWKKHNDGRDSRGEHWQCHLFGADACGLARFLSLGEVAVNVLQHDRRVIDQAFDREREAAQRHDVDGRAVHQQPKRAGQYREWYGQEDREGRAEAPEENQDHQRGEHRAGNRLVLERVDGIANIRSLAEDRLELHPAGEVGNLLQYVLDAVDDRNRVGAALLENRDIDRTLTIDAHDVLLNLCRVLRVSHVPDEHRRLAFANLDRDV